MTIDLRHTVATLAYRAAKALKDAPPGFSEFRPADGSRSAGEILSHMCDLFGWALSIAQGKETWHNTKPQTWEQDSKRFFDALTAFDAQLASGDVQATAEKLFQGPIADALTHTGQIAMLRRLAGSWVRAENYSVAAIEPGRTGAKQNEPTKEFGPPTPKSP
jgi:hypothetical protein